MIPESLGGGPLGNWQCHHSCKTAWNLTSFKWTNGIWQYQNRAKTSAEQLVKDIHRTEHRLSRLDFNNATTTLGVEIAPDGNMKRQKEVLLGKATKWADQMQHSKLSKYKGWVVLASTNWKTITCPLPATSLTQEECEKIMAPAVGQALTTMGFCKNFPGALVLGLRSFMAWAYSIYFTTKKFQGY
jgi:hypothetical protein